MRSTRTWGWIRWIISLSDVAETWWDAGGIFACPDTDSFSARCQNREGHSPLAIHTAAFVHVLVLLAAGFALCFRESINFILLYQCACRLNFPRCLYDGPPRRAVRKGGASGRTQTKFSWQTTTRGRFRRAQAHYALGVATMTPGCSLN